MLGNIIVEGEIDPYQGARLLENYQPVDPPDDTLLERVAQVHRQLGKMFKRAGNRWDLLIPEVISVVKWIALQEDIKYPMPRYEGRRMPFARYLEAIHCAETKWEVDRVIRRALSHSLPRRWRGVDCGMVDRLLSDQE